MKDSLGREPRWNADRCAPGAPGAAVAVSHGRIFIASVGVSPPNLFRSFPFVIAGRRPGNPCGSCARPALPPALCLLKLGIARVQRRAARTARYCERHKWREAIQSEALPWIASSLSLLAMTSDLTSPPVPLFPAAGHPSPPRGDYLEG